MKHIHEDLLKLMNRRTIMDEKVKLNEKELTQEEFENEKEKLEKNKGIKVVETGTDEYKTRIQE